MYPIRGVVLRTEKSTLLRSVADDVGPNALAYVIPRSNDCILGGLAERGADSMEITDEEIAGIQRRCGALSPALRFATILEAKVGLRPGRSTVRCEPDNGNPRVIHNYGHGGSGFTVCWGCAEDVVAMAREKSAA
jgi:D-amino-acid oxidase